MTPAELKKSRHALGLSAEGFARLTGTASGRTVRKWESGENDIPGAIVQLVALLEWLPARTRDAAMKMLAGNL